jgi:thiamine pyrophosphate-dependent acetolactate synthase large subunit-like protein
MTLTRPEAEVSESQGTVGEIVTGGELVVRTLERLGVDHAFNVPGLGMFPLLEAFYRHRSSIRYVSAVNETNVSLIAHGYSAGSGKPAFLNVYHASGTGLAMMSVTTAWADHVPLVVTTTTSSRQLSARDQYAAVAGSITEMTQAYTKWSYEVTLPERIPEVLARAFALAEAPPRGPVHIALPMDILAAETVDRTYGTGDLLLYDEQCAHHGGIAELAERLIAARNPVIVAGQEVQQYGAIEELVRVAEAIGCPVMSDTSIARYGFPHQHPQYVGKMPANADLLADADFVLLIGAELTETGGPEPWRLLGAASTAFLSVDPREVQKHIRPSLALIGHPKPTLAAVAREIGAAPNASGNRERAATARQRWADAATELRRDRWANAPIAIGRLVTELSNAMPPGTVVVNQAGGDYGFVESLLAIDPGSYYGISGKASAQGWAGPASVGIQLARSGQRVVAIIGDGGFMFSSTSIRTAAQFHVPVIYIVLNNGGWRDVGAGMNTAGYSAGRGEDELGWKWTDTPIGYAAFAESLGVRGETVTRPDDLADALQRAFASPEPTLLEIISDPYEAELFAQGRISSRPQNNQAES